MNRFDELRRWAWSVLVAGAVAIALVGCSGDDGKDGAVGPTGPAGPPGAPAPVPDAITAAIDSAQVESCATCHSGVGDGHQALYNRYTDGTPSGGSNLVIAFDEASLSVVGAGPYTVSVNFTITQNGQPLASLNDLKRKSFYVTQYSNGEYFQPTSLSAAGANGAFTASSDAVPFDPTTNASFLAYIGDQDLIIDDVNYAAHMALYENAASAGFETAGAEAYQSAANVSGCEACHGTPYLKHGHRPAAVAGLQDFAACKACHYDDRTGGHGAWQWMVDDPYAWATEALTNDEVNAAYPYTANVMSDVHMSHAMEFPYPQSMANCNTCHAGKLDVVLDNSNFQLETCMSCHPLEGKGAWPGEEYNQPQRAPAFAYLWQKDSDLSFHNGVLGGDCTECHGNPSFDPPIPSFSDLHSGYDKYIYDDAGNRYATMYTASIDGVTFDAVNNTLTVDYSASDVTVVPELLVSLYGWNTKDFIVASHSRDANGDRMEYEPGAVNPLFTADATVAPPAYRTTVNLGLYAADVTDDIPTLIANMDVNKIEVTVTPFMDIGLAEDITLDAVTATYDLAAGAVVSDYFKGNKAIVDYTKCNDCHDQLAVTFHSGSGRAGEITVCRNCHVPTSGGSHLEMQSRSIDSYVHAIHSFQDFDLQGGRNPGIFDSFDPVRAKEYAEHIEHTFPNFTITNCEACHNPGTYNVPDQSKSMPGTLSDSWALNTWYELVETSGANTVAVAAPSRNIGAVPAYVTGPASRACGGCHRAEFINEDKPSDLAAFNAHTEAFGTLVENTDNEILYGIINKIMTWFE